MRYLLNPYWQIIIIEYLVFIIVSYCCLIEAMEIRAKYKWGRWLLLISAIVSVTFIYFLSKNYL